MLDQMIVLIGITSLVMISPGPDMVLVLRNTLAGGRQAGLRTALGLLTGSLVHIGYCIVGIGWLISQSILAFNLLRYAGAAYLIYLGISSLRSGDATARDTATHDRSEVAPRTWFLQGVLNSLLNPKATLFFLGVFTVVITPDTSIPTKVVLVMTMVSVSAAFWLLFVLTLDQAFIRRALERGQKRVNRVFGVLLVALGVRVATMDR